MSRRHHAAAFPLRVDGVPTVGLIADDGCRPLAGSFAACLMERNPGREGPPVVWASTGEEVPREDRPQRASSSCSDKASVRRCTCSCVLPVVAHVHLRACHCTLPENRHMPSARIFAECRAYGTRQSFRPVPFGRPVRQFAVPFASSTVRPSVPFQLFLPSATWHTAKVCRVPEKRHSAKPASPVEEKPCALCRVLHSANNLPSVFLPLPSVCDTRQST